MTIRLIAGDCRDVLATLPADSVHTCVTSPPYYALRSYLDASHVDKHREIGSEPTPDAYLQTMVQVFREVRRVLRPDGTCWVNMGDSYSAGGGGPKPGNIGGETEKVPVSLGRRSDKPKDLLMMPARLALALQADGWWVRSAIVWAKPNPMPESVTDRPTSAYEMVYLLTRSARYFYDADAVREGADPNTLAKNPIYGKLSNEAPLHLRSTRSNGEAKRGHSEMTYYDSTRNLRNVWTLATHAYPQAHFATYPPELAERCIRAGTSERGCCAQCGKPWTRVSDTSYERNRHGHSGRTEASGSNGWDGGAYPNLCKVSTTTGWQPGCSHDADIVPCTVLDPFAGAGTTLLVADRLQRDAIGVELNTAYTQMAMDRVRADAPLFADLAPVPEPPEDERMADLFEGDEYQRLPPAPKSLQVPRGWDTGPGAHGTIHRTGRTLPEAAD